MTAGQWRLTVGIVARGETATTGGDPSKANNADGIIQSLGYGTGDDTFSILVFQRRSLPPATSETLNLFDGTLLDINKFPAPFRVLRSCFFWVDDGGDEDGVTIGNAASNPNTIFLGGTTPTATIYPDGPGYTGGTPVGIAVTSSACNIKVANNGAEAVTYGIALAGSQAAAGAAMGVLGLTYS